MGILFALAILVLAMTQKKMISNLIGVQDDGHIFDLIRAKLTGNSTPYHFVAHCT
jgi:hypothetical protein